ncbi:sensor domain-containing diguanylate cyclase [Paraburkholderia caballeronis]|uniref:diguanylate cyclase n=1 Tax=Paraburkholderia caballeronis TaxID=416943 RepID=A0A1H7RBS1_9BURK|nr:sensor domain-containing diguanylate cyclase [Paraburkholderia caballeronis]PXW23550.1 diguanylate cyclase (GGDEF)-like protein [Paraburkholderia caballeronis]PXW98891.1 diguanylate cyclase (GGDEF)-like protein [Paraburkholderia caballeronis]RAJ96097.1 diguanylate cyclase (GGDEF)-like protein [Paraburkholderia caballeronis]SEC76086.1 diguanylate cyclase (GGDEF) domain-containing protein [Paraburkholderia caballeronis]SEL57582.1 diguanylate cyclase (GGDEF) domain-containing protein [Paraburk
MNRTLLRWTAGSVGIVAVVLVCWVIAGLVADRLVRQELEGALNSQRQMTRSVVGNMAEVIASDLSMSRAIPATMAETGVVQQALAQAAHYALNRYPTELARRTVLLKAPEFAEVNMLLHDAQGFSGLDAIWLVNTTGICVASSNASDRMSYIGIDMHTRAYLNDTLLGAFAEMYGVGNASGEPGIFVAAPVYSDGLLVGAVVAKVSIARLRHWVAHPGTFVSDNNGVIIMAHNSALEGLALPGSHVEDMNAIDRVNTYLRERFTEIALQPAAPSVRRVAPWVPRADAEQLVELPGQPTPALYESRGGLNSGLSAHLVDPVNSWPELLANHHRNRLLIFLTLAGTVALAAVISVSWVRERRLHRATRELAEQLQSANALLAAEARDDALTGALSRRYFLDLLRHEIDRAYEVGAPLCMAIADLDYFKQINDRFGHPAGDRALQHFIETCRTELRADDAVGRLGGEEFGILLPATTLTTGLTVVERLREQVRNRHCAELPADVILSVSIGITELAAKQDQPERLMSRADRALYAAKSAGRDRCEAVPPDGAVPPRTPENAW